MLAKYVPKRIWLIFTIKVYLPLVCAVRSLIAPICPKSFRVESTTAIRYAVFVHFYQQRVVDVFIVAVGFD